MRSRAAGTVLALVVGALAAGELGAQSVGGGPILQTYTFENTDAAGVESIQLITAPFAVAVPVLSNLAVSVSGAYARGAATSAEGQEVTLAGLTDTNIDVAFAPGPDWLIVTAGVTAPTGHNTHTVGESLVAGIIAAELLPFAIKTWGSGGSVGGTVAATTQLGAWGVGLAGGYRLASEYEPLEAQAIGYRPGDQMQLRLAFDRNVGTSSTVSVLLGVQSFGSDQVGGAELFRSGARFEGVLTYAFPLGLRNSALLYGGVYHRANGAVLGQETALGGATDSPAQQLFMAGTSLRLPIGRRAALRPNADIRVFRAEDGASQGWVTSAGGTFDVRVAGTRSGRRLVLAPSAQVRLGRVIVSDDLETGLFGWEAGVALRVELGR